MSAYTAPGLLRLSDGGPELRTRGSDAAWELERRYLRAPVEGPARLLVLIRVPEGAVVGRVDAHGRVVAPAAESARLGASSCLYVVLALERAERIGGDPACIADRREDRRRVRGAVADGDVTGF